MHVDFRFLSFAPVHNRSHLRHMSELDVLAVCSCQPHPIRRWPPREMCLGAAWKGDVIIRLHSAGAGAVLGIAGTGSAETPTRTTTTTTLLKTTWAQTGGVARGL